MNIAYFFNTYPQPSLTALRREVVAIESLGQPIHRFSVRRFNRPLADPEDQRELERTRYILDAGPLGLLMALCRTLFTHPIKLARACALAFQLGRVSERGILRHFIYTVEACLLRKWLAELQIDHVHTHYGTNSAATVMLCHALGGPSFSFTMHGPEEFDSPRAWSLGAKIHHAQFVIAITEFTRSQLYRWADYHDWPRIHVVHVGVSPMFLEHGPAPIPDAPRLVNIGRIVEQKGQAILVQAAAQLRDRGIPFELVIVGDGPMRPEIERLIQHFQLEQSVRITGYLSNQGVLDELLAARALVLPSFAEGLPGVFFESLALGRPVISTYLAGHPELIEPGVNGWLVPPGAVEPLVEAMAQVLTADTTTLAQMGRAGADRIATDHNMATEARKILHLFQSRGASTHAPSTPIANQPQPQGALSGA